MKKLQTILVLMLMALTANAQLCPDNNHPHMIDLGLPSGTKWACCNVDAKHPENQSPTNYGGYYAWGETEVKDVYNHVTYQYASGIDDDGDGHYNDWHEDTHCYGVWKNIGREFVDNDGYKCYDIAGTQYDVAHVKWGGSWVMPSLEQIKELLDNCTYVCTTVNGVNGLKFTSKINGGTIFLSASGDRRSNGIFIAGGGAGFYWSSTQDPLSSYGASGLGIDLNDEDCFYYIEFDARYIGYMVRPVSR